jgi:hypothetical protein
MKTIYPILLLLILFSCKRDLKKNDSIGPTYITTEVAFAVSSDPADFTVGNVHFNAKLTGSAAWKIEVKGTNSGAIKRFSGNSQYIDLSNTGWDGMSDTTLAFMSEPCTATLYIPISRVTKIINFNCKVYSGPFTITQTFAIHSDPVDLSFSPTYFTAQFSNIKSWVVTITGNTSGAVKEITGSSKSLTLNNTIWDGSSDTCFFFGAETCQAILSFPDTVLTETISFSISVPKTHPGYLINDFEEPALGTYLGSNNGTFFDTPDQATSTIDLFTFSPAPQGSKVLRFDCNDVNANYYSGGIYHNSVATTYGIPSMSSDSLYLNLFIYGYAGGNASISLQVSESDGDSWTPAQINVNWTGWKLISLKFSTMSNYNGTGNLTRETNKINSVNMSMNSVPAGLNCKALVDYLIFTKNKVLHP